MSLPDPHAAGETVAEKWPVALVCPECGGRMWLTVTHKDLQAEETVSEFYPRCLCGYVSEVAHSRLGYPIAE